MRTIIGLRLRRDKRGVSNIIVVVLSLIVITIIVSNVVLWSYQMNQLDWERAKEDVKITSVTSTTLSSGWFTVQGEYAINRGSRTGGTYTDTQTDNGVYETFLEGLPAATYALNINGTFVIDISTYPFSSISTIEVQLKYRTSSTEDTWFLLAYNWTSGTFSNNGFNSTGGDPSPTTWDYYAVNMTTQWQSYVRSDGTVYVKFCDEQAFKGTNEPSPPTRTSVDIDFLGVRVVGEWTLFTIKNDGPFSSRIVSIWVIDPKGHRRYNADAVVNSGETFSYLRVDIRLSSAPYTVKAVTEKGNIAVYFSG